MSEKKRRDKLSGTSAILFLHIENESDDDASDDHLSMDDEEDNPLARLGSLLHNIPRDPPVPLLVMTTSRDCLGNVFLLI